MSPEQVLLTFVVILVGFLIMLEDRDPNQNGNSCIDRHPLCPKWSILGHCQRNHTQMLRECPLSCDSCDDLNWSEHESGCPHKYGDCEDCRDTSDECIAMKADGACSQKPGFMVIHCAKTCKLCHLRKDEALRYPKNEAFMAETRILPNPGDLHRFFQGIVAFYDSNENELEWSLEILSRDPWILRFDDFFSEKEAEGIMDAAESIMEHKANSKASKIRNGRIAWCTERENDECWRSEAVQSAMQRLENLLNISMDNSEHLQVLEYGQGQFYRAHHDFIDLHRERRSGPRILTLFMYLSDVEEGGATNFPRLNIQNEPKMGRLLLWPSVLNEDPTKKDWRTLHEAMEVVKGRKLAANVWFHLNDVQTDIRWACGRHSPFNKQQTG